MNLDNKKFVTAENKSGLSSDKTTFHYFQNGAIITARYKGGSILEGMIIGKHKEYYKARILNYCINASPSMEN